MTSPVPSRFSREHEVGQAVIVQSRRWRCCWAPATSGRPSAARTRRRRPRAGRRNPRTSSHSYLVAARSRWPSRSKSSTTTLRALSVRRKAHRLEQAARAVARQESRSEIATGDDVAGAIAGQVADRDVEPPIRGRIRAREDEGAVPSPQEDADRAVRVAGATRLRRSRCRARRRRSGRPGRSSPAHGRPGRAQTERNDRCRSPAGCRPIRHRRPSRSPPRPPRCRAGRRRSGRRSPDRRGDCPLCSGPAE